MSDFYKAHEFTARWEGGFVNHPKDPGGATNYGVSLRWLKSLSNADGDIDRDGDIDVDDIRALTAEQAAELFKAEFWDKYHLEDFPQGVATVYYDTIVNTGAMQATKIMQRGCNAATGSRLSVDGRLGPLTRSALKNETPALISACIREREQFYRNLAHNKPSTYSVFLTGWLNRTEALRKELGA